MCRFAGLSSGANRDRTGDLLLAKQALSHLSYGPEKSSLSADLRRLCQPERLYLALPVTVAAHCCPFKALHQRLQALRVCSREAGDAWCVFFASLVRLGLT